MGFQGVGARGRSWLMRVFWGKVYTKTPGLYQVPNWSYGQKNKKGEMGGLMWVQGGWTLVGGSGRIWRFRGSTMQKPQPNWSYGKKTKKMGKWGVLGGGPRKNPL